MSNKADLVSEIPSNIILKKVRPSIWLSFLIIAWGIVMTCMGVVKNFHGLVACRVVLGVFEVCPFYHPVWSPVLTSI